MNLELANGSFGKCKGDGVMRIEGEARRKEIITAIKTYIDTHGYSPTVRELGEMVGLKSSSTIHRNLEVLKSEGKISWNPTMPRTIQVLKK